MNKKICPLCEKETNNIVDIVKNIWQNNKNVYECKNCGLYFIDEPSQKEMEILYKSDFYIKNTNPIYNFIDRKMQYARALDRFNYINKFVNKTDDLNVLEIGASNGLLLSMFKNRKSKKFNKFNKRNTNVFGYELNQKARKNALDKYGIEMKENFLEDLENNKNKYDIIIMSHILEHFTNPKYIVKNLHNFIRGG